MNKEQLHERIFNDAALLSVEESIALKSFVLSLWSSGLINNYESETYIQQIVDRLAKDIVDLVKSINSPSQLCQLLYKIKTNPDAIFCQFYVVELEKIIQAKIEFLS
jgi:hypothetical protein